MSPAHRGTPTPGSSPCLLRLGFSSCDSQQSLHGNFLLLAPQQFRPHVVFCLLLGHCAICLGLRCGLNSSASSCSHSAASVAAMSLFMSSKLFQDCDFSQQFLLHLNVVDSVVDIWFSMNAMRSLMASSLV